MDSCKLNKVNILILLVFIFSMLSFGTYMLISKCQDSGCVSSLRGIGFTLCVFALISTFFYVKCSYDERHRYDRIINGYPPASPVYRSI